MSDGGSHDYWQPPITVDMLYDPASESRTGVTVHAMNRADGQHGNAYEWLSKITYKPGWKFELEEERNAHHLYNLMYFRITTQQTSADGSVDHAILCSTHGISPEAFMDRDHFLMIVEHAIRDAEMHEVDEWLKYDGKHIRDPHPVVNNAIGKKP